MNEVYGLPCYIWNSTLRYRIVLKWDLESIGHSLARVLACTPNSIGVDLSQACFRARVKKKMKCEILASHFQTILRISECHRNCRHHRSQIPTEELVTWFLSACYWQLFSYLSRYTAIIVWTSNLLLPQIFLKFSVLSAKEVGVIY